ncbi:MAG: GTPase HflX, partial [Gemmatimonadetes bacterium]|nr:GTPase HflX [Gemmatimonadota bacterium]
MSGEPKMFEPRDYLYDRERAVLVGVSLPAPRTSAGGVVARGGEGELLEELQRLVESAGGKVVGAVHQNRVALNSATYVGRGKAEEVRDLVAATDAEMVVFDSDLSPAQGKNLEDVLGVRVVDRSEIILDIFARRARTREARLQVELAQLQYLLPRLKRMWTHLSRIRGGIGLRGPGETQLEVDRRAIRTKIAHLKERLAGIQERRETQRKSRSELFNIALVGYTNAGKSTLLNRLAGADVGAADRLFETLDATTRRVPVDERHSFLLTDTVGFVRELPHHLVASFRATLEEVVEADLLLHVVDVSDLDYEPHMRVVEEVLATLGVERAPRLVVFNKSDRLDATEREGVLGRARRTHPDCVVSSGVAEGGLEELRAEILARLRDLEEEVWLRLPVSDARGLARLHERGTVLERRFRNGFADVRFAGRKSEVQRLRGEGKVIAADAKLPGGEPDEAR